MPIKTSLGQVRSPLGHIYVFLITNSDVFEVGGGIFKADPWLWNPFF